MPSIISNFSLLSEKDKFYFDVDNRTHTFQRLNGCSFEKGNLKPIDYNAVDLSNGSCWVFDAEDKVIKL